MHSTPTAALEVILMLPPIDIYIEEEVGQATYRLNCSGELRLFVNVREHRTHFFFKILSLTVRESSSGEKSDKK
jgi:hypothetical protein